MSAEKLERPLRSVSGNHEWGEAELVDNNVAIKSHWQRLEQKLKEIGVESRGMPSWGLNQFKSRLNHRHLGVKPVPTEERQDTQFYKIFFIWFSASCNILSFSGGTLGPAVFGLGIRDSCLTSLFFNSVYCLAPAVAWVPTFIVFLSY